LVSADFPWQAGRDYIVSLEAADDLISLSIDGIVVLKIRDATHRAGMAGCGSLEAARALYGPFLIEEL